MKILPVIHNNSLNLLCAKKYLASTINSKSDDGSMRPKSAYTYRPASFKGLDTIAFIGDLKNLDNLHWPALRYKNVFQKRICCGYGRSQNSKNTGRPVQVS